MTMPEDWHPEQIKAAIRMRGVTMTDLALRNGYDESAVRRTLRHRWPAVERIIARFLDKHPNDIWPSRYEISGRPKRQRSNGKRMVNARLRQKSQAA